MTIDLNSIYDKSDKVTARKVEDEFIIVSIETNKNGLVDELYTLNETGRELWDHLNGEFDLYQLIQAISNQYHKEFHLQIQKDVIALMKELLLHKIVKKVNPK
jgi:DNA-binding PadR family transcriptional regulator